MTRVLVVEDYPALLTLYREVLSKDYDCLAVGSAEEAIEALAEAEFDVVVADVALPGMSGLDLLKLLRKRRPQMPVIIISGCMRLDRTEIVSELGAYACLEKPFSHEDLVDSINHAIINKSSRKVRRQNAGSLSNTTSANDHTPISPPGGGGPMRNE